MKYKKKTAREKKTPTAMKYCAQVIFHFTSLFIPFIRTMNGELVRVFFLKKISFDQ